MKRDIIFDAIVWSMPLCQRGKEGRVLRAARVAWTTVEISEWVYSRWQQTKHLLYAIVIEHFYYSHITDACYMTGNWKPIALENNQKIY